MGLTAVMSSGYTYPEFRSTEHLRRSGHEGRGNTSVAVDVVPGMPLTGDYAPSTSDWAREQAEKYEASNGSEANTLLDRGMPIILVTSIGAKTGKLRKTPLMRVEHNGEYAAVASLGGAPKHPVWYYNLKANPTVELRDGDVVKDYTAREVTGEEKAVWWERAVAAYPDYADYQEKTAREIPVFVLTPKS